MIATPLAPPGTNGQSSDAVLRVPLPQQDDLKSYKANLTIPLSAQGAKPLFRPAFRSIQWPARSLAVQSIEMAIPHAHLDLADDAPDQGASPVAIERALYEQVRAGRLSRYIHDSETAEASYYTAFVAPGQWNVENRTAVLEAIMILEERLNRTIMLDLRRDRSHAQPG